jgi:hypothetical protein
MFHSFYGAGGDWWFDRTKGNAHLLPPPAHFNKNYKKCDEMAKKRDEMAAGVVFGWKNRGGGSRETIALTEAPRRGAAKPQ